MAMRSPDGGFRASFERWARRVRHRLALRVVLTGAALGLTLGAAGAAAAWRSRHDALRPLAAAGGLVGAAAGLALARRRRWANGHVALYLDERLGSNEAITTAMELEERQDTSPARAVVVAQAAVALGHADPKKVRPPLLHAGHAALPIAAGALTYFCLLPLPPAPAQDAPPPGADSVRMSELSGLDKILRLAEVEARDAAQEERLKKLAKDANELRDKLRNGVERREAQADIATLRDAITAERLSLGQGDERPGLEAALGRLGEDPRLERAAEALGDRDLVAFDEEMEQLANRLEEGDRQRAKRTLEEALEAAKRAGAENVARALEEQKRLLDERGKRADKLRELAEALGQELGAEEQDALSELGRTGSRKDAQKLAESLEKALGKLSAEERRRLAERLKKELARQPGGADTPTPTRDELRELAEELGSPEGQAELEEQLRRMASEAGAEGGEAGRQRALDDAQEGAGEVEGQLGGRPMPLPVAGGPTSPRRHGAKPGEGGGKNGEQGQPGRSEGGGRGSHAGQTGVVPGGELKARASAPMNPGQPLPGTVLGRAAGRAGESANVQGEGALGLVGPGELGGIERSEVPEEYREQVGRYFEPK